MMITNQSKVLLPERILDPVNQLESVLEYLKSYPNYTLIRIEDSYAICEIPRGEK
ncbi:hypothetical protein ACFSO7_02780 [Bacillus sp. CGMCC 1.16607]|uniref:hypothetical protein n=1 Tax=Bacillus sp. CGMCC 1.16607 TaxID=3351842 RepID=UPI00362E00AF